MMAKEDAIDDVIEYRKIRDAYTTLQKAYGLKVGDKVKILRTAEDCEMGWEEGWIEPMTQSVGRLGEVVDIDSIAGIRVYTDLFGKYWYPFYVLERVK